MSANRKITSNSKQILYLSHDDLLTHPKNMRRFYPEDQAREMADSIRASKGVYQAMLIIPNGKAGKYFVVDGNMRLAGARLLGKDCPPLKCELITANKAEQLLSMVVTAKFRYAPDPISEALHYKRLMAEERYNSHKIAYATGVHSRTIETRLRLLDLEPEIQELVAANKLPTNWEAVEAFLSISDSKARVKLAQRLADNMATVKAIVKSCEQLSTQMKETSAIKTSAVPAVTIGRQRAFGRTVSPDKTAQWKQVRNAAAAKAMCEACDLKLSSLASAPEPAWTLITHAAGETCRNCNVRDVKSACNECPGVDIMRRLILAIGEKRS